VVSLQRLRSPLALARPLFRRRVKRRGEKEKKKRFLHSRWRLVATALLAVGGSGCFQHHAVGNKDRGKKREKRKKGNRKTHPGGGCFRPFTRTVLSLHAPDLRKRGGEKKKKKRGPWPRLRRLIRPAPVGRTALQGSVSRGEREERTGKISIASNLSPCCRDHRDP